MAHPYTTHHNACDCREAPHTEEVARLRSALSAIAAEGDACTCHVRSWYGSDHDTACPITIARAALDAPPVILAAARMFDDLRTQAAHAKHVIAKAEGAP